MSTATVVILIVAIVAVGIALLMYLQKEKSRKLRSQFGTEYDRLIDQENGNARRAEAILEQRQKRVNKFPIRALNREQCDRFARDWQIVQGRFVDDPGASVGDADRLVIEALKARGYPMVDFEQRSADLSVEHPETVENYRIAHAIALSHERGEATTEDLRKAMQHYRSLFEHVLDTNVSDYTEVHR